MFRKLRNKLILMNLGITTAVVVAVFSVVYISSTESAERRPPMMMTFTHINEPDENAEVEQIVFSSLDAERQAAAKQLLITLTIAGLTIEAAVALISYFLAELAIRPVREAYESQKVFIANASHEIKTPLAAIQANLEVADIHGNKWIKNVEIETTKLAKLNSELLTLARTDLITTREKSEVDIAKTVDEIVKSFNPRAKNLNLKLKIITREKTQVNREDFMQIISILLDNAVKYADKKVQVEVEGRKIVVMNDGAKISAEALPHIFERFYQVDKSAEGVGLGLSIAKALAERNGFELTAESGRMTKFTLAV